VQLSPADIFSRRWIGRLFENLTEQFAKMSTRVSGRCQIALRIHPQAAPSQLPPVLLEPVWKFRGCPVFAEKTGWRGAPREDTRSGLRPRSNEASRPFPRKPSGRRVFWLWPALARPSQPAAGMLRPRRLGHSQNPSPQDPTEFSDRLLAAASWNGSGPVPFRRLVREIEEGIIRTFA